MVKKPPKPHQPVDSLDDLLQALSDALGDIARQVETLGRKSWLLGGSGARFVGQPASLPKRRLKKIPLLTRPIITNNFGFGQSQKQDYLKLMVVGQRLGCQ